MHKTHTLRKKMHPAVGVALLTLIGLALRIWFAAVNELDPTNSPADDGDYYQRALRFATTGQYIDDFWLVRPPLHVFLFAVMLRMSIIIGTIPGLTLVRAAQIVLSIVSIPIGYDLSRRLFGQRAGLIFAVILAIWYPLVELPTYLFTEPLFIMLLLTHLWLLIVWHDERRWSLLVLSGVFLGLTALTRSVGVYGAPFVVLWLVLDSLGRKDSILRRGAPAQRSDKDLDMSRNAAPVFGITQWLSSLLAHVRQHGLTIARQIALFVVPLALVILPWTIRNYIVYERFILIDTIGSVNLWLHMEKYEEKGVEIIRQLPQRDRHIFSIQDTRRMFFDDPVLFWNMLWRNAWLHFLHIWKAQFIEDFLLKISFYGRPLRAVWPLGMFGDALWFVFTAASLTALARPLHDGPFRWVALCWAAYTMLTVMLFHLEPRYLMPLWLVFALYGSWGLATLPNTLVLVRRRTWHGMLAIGLVGIFLVLFVSYRNYPATLVRGYKRESHRAAGIRAYEAGDYAQAMQEFEAMLAAHPTFVSSQAELGLALIANQQYEEARNLLGTDDAQHILVARGALARAQGDFDQAANLLTQAEKKSGDNVQRMAMQWLPRSPTSWLMLGNGQDFGYIEGFSWAEKTGTSLERPYRWMQGRGHIIMPLPQPLEHGNILALQMTGGCEQLVPLQIALTGVGEQTYRLAPVQVASGQWRTYRVLLPNKFSGTQTLDVMLEAPVVLPAHVHSDTNDIRPLSLMVHAVWVR